MSYTFHVPALLFAVLMGAPVLVPAVAPLAATQAPTVRIDMM